MSKEIAGYYHDVLTNAKGEELFDSGWKSNLIVSECNLLLSALMKGKQGITGILYFAAGTGKKEWDQERPDSNFATASLENEVTRKAITSRQITFLDDSNNPIDAVTNRLEVAVEFNGGEIAAAGFQSLREFGLFGGDATEDTDSGFMIDYVVHPRIDMSKELTLKRSVRLNFGIDNSKQAEKTEIFEPLPVVTVDPVIEEPVVVELEPLLNVTNEEYVGAISLTGIIGVGSSYATALKSSNINTVVQLANVDPNDTIGNISLVKLRELKAKAQMVTELTLDVSLFTELASYSITDLLNDSPENILGLITIPDVNVDAVSQLQKKLATLQLALKSSQLQKVMFGGLFSI